MGKVYVNDLEINYSSDILSCFERPIAIALGMENENLEQLFILISKMNGIFNHKNSPKSFLFEKVNHLMGYEVERCNMSYSHIERVLSDNRILICGINLKAICFNSNFNKRDWPHWTIISGVSKNNKTVDIFDNMQFWDEQHIYEHMTVQFKDIKYAHRMYKKRYGQEFCGYSLKRTRMHTRIEMLKSILVEYFERDFKDGSTYFSLVLLQKINEISKLMGNEKSLMDEFKKRLINTNKYKQVIFDIIKKEMKYYGYDEIYVEEFEVNTHLLSEKWAMYIMFEVISAVNQIDYNPQLTTNIIELEEYVSRLIRNFKRYLDDCSLSTKDGEIIKNSLVTEIENGVRFDLSNEHDVHNWWNEEDNSIKKVIQESCIIDGYQANLTVNIEKEPVAGNFQAGIYIKDINGTNVYTLGIQDNEYLFLDEVGLIGYKETITKQDTHSMQFNIKDNILTISGQDDSERKMLKTSIDCTKEYEIGYFCKTWNEPAKVKVSVQLDKKLLKNKRYIKYYT